jgi:cell division protein FtsN
MDWMRRNWPDLLIGLALLLVIGGIIATLLNGGNFLPFGRGPQPAPATSTPTTGTTPEAVSPTDPNGTTPSANGTEVAPLDLNQPSSTEAVSVGDETGTIVPVPPSTDGTPIGDAATTAIDNAVEAVAPDAADTTETATDAADTTQVAASTSSTTPYRVSVGAFGNAENAERKAQSFKDAGYPVFVGKQGDLSLVLIGPYATQAEAEQVKAELQSSGLEAEPIVYEFKPDDAAAASSDTAPAPDVVTATSPDAASADAADTTSATSALPTNSSGRYLQVGAYGSVEASAPQRSLLEGLGFTVSSVEEGTLIKLLVGPYDDANLSDAQSRLSAQGIENFVR